MDEVIVTLARDEFDLILWALRQVSRETCGTLADALAAQLED